MYSKYMYMLTEIKIVLNFLFVLLKIWIILNYYNNNE